MKRFLRNLIPSWTSDGTGFSSKKNLHLFGYHPKGSLTWTWSVYWHKPTGQFCWHRCKLPASGELRIGAPLLGSISIAWQDRIPMRQGVVENVFLEIGGVSVPVKVKR